jgi:hypothetical protein
MQQLIDELRPQPIQVAFEATYGWGWSPICSRS